MMLFIPLSRLLVKDEIKKGSFETDPWIRYGAFATPFGERIKIKDTEQIHLIKLTRRLVNMEFVFINFCRRCNSQREPSATTVSVVGSFIVSSWVAVAEAGVVVLLVPFFQPLDHMAEMNSSGEN